MMERNMKKNDNGSALVAEKTESVPEKKVRKGIALLDQRSAYIRRRMGGLYKPEMSMQVRLAARLLLKVEELSLLMEDESYSPVVSEVSREGNIRLVANPLEKMYLDNIVQLQSALKALGMNFDSKERKDDGGLGGILDAFKMESS